MNSENSKLVPGELVPYRDYLKGLLPGLSDETCWRWVRSASVPRLTGAGKKSYARRADLDALIEAKLQGSLAREMVQS